MTPSLAANRHRGRGHCLSLAATMLGLIVGAGAGAGCDGYADLPLPMREFGTLRVERAERFTEGPGVAQVALDPPADAIGPFVIVGHPAALSGGSAIRSWAVGTCAGSPTPTDPALRLCLAVEYARGGAAADPLAIGVVVESRGDARRFTLRGVAPSGDLP